MCVLVYSAVYYINTAYIYTYCISQVVCIVVCGIRCEMWRVVSCSAFTHPCPTLCDRAIVCHRLYTYITHKIFQRHICPRMSIRMLPLQFTADITTILNQNILLQHQPMSFLGTSSIEKCSLLVSVRAWQ